MIRDKTCTKCGVTHPLSAYTNDRTRPDGKFPWCKSCRNSSLKSWYTKNSERHKASVTKRKLADPEKVKERDRNYYKKTKEKHKAKSLEWSRNNKEKRRNIARKWAANNLEYARLKEGRRRATLRASTTVRITAEDIAQRVQVFDGRCAYCGGPYEHMDHVKAVHLGGPHILANLRPACKACNQRKGATPAKEWFASLHGRRTEV